MNRPLIIHRIALGLVVMATIVMTMPRLINTGDPSSYNLLFTYPDGSPCAHPCLLGIHPGQTTFAEGNAILNAQPLLEEAVALPGSTLTQSSEFMAVHSGFQTEEFVAMIATYNTNALDSIQITWSKGQNSVAPSIGELQGLLGDPLWVRVEAVGCLVYTMLYFPGEYRVVIPFRERIQPDESVVSISLSVNARNPELEYTRWQGYSNTILYGDLNLCPKPEI